MRRNRFLFAAALALAATSAGVAQAQMPVVSTDFTLQDMSRLPTNWTLNGYARLELNTVSATPLVDLGITNNEGNNASAVWTNDTFMLPSFTMWADVNIDFHPHTTALAGVDMTCPADGFAMAFAATTDQYSLGGGGGSIGLYGSDDIPQFIAAEVNTWYGNDLDDTSTCTTGKNVTFEFTNADSNTGNGRSMGGDTNAGGAYIGQVTAPDALQKMGLVNGGWFRYQWDVDSTAGTMDLYLTGLQDSNKAIQNMKVNSVKFAASAPKLMFKGRFGLTAGTGGGTQGTHVAQVVVVSPAVAPGTALPAAGTTTGATTAGTTTGTTTGGTTTGATTAGTTTAGTTAGTTTAGTTTGTTTGGTTAGTTAGTTTAGTTTAGTTTGTTTASTTAGTTTAGTTTGTTAAGTTTGATTAGTTTDGATTAGTTTA